MGKLEYLTGIATGVAVTVGAGIYMEHRKGDSAAPSPTSLPGMSVEVVQSTLPSQQPSSGETSTSLPVMTTTPEGFAIIYPLSSIACRQILDGVVDATADRVDLPDGTVTWSSLKAMERISPGDDGYSRIDPSARAETFAAEVMSTSGVVLSDVNITPPGTAFRFGSNCVDQLTGQPLNIAFPPKTEGQ